MKNDYFKNLSDSLVGLLNTVLAQESFHLFKRSPRVVLGVPFAASSPDYHLFYVGHEWLETDTSSFRCEAPEGVFVLRNPNRIRVTYSLLVSQASLAARLDTWDRLVAYFFDHPAIDAFIPDSLKEIPGLYERLLQEKAILSAQAMNNAASAHSANEPVQLSLHYTALYHSGAVQSREALVKQRVIEYRNRERSVP